MSMTADFALVVRFVLVPDTRAGFLALVADNAAQSVREEPGCCRFDVLEVLDRPDEVLLYEIYHDRAAFDLHLASAHYRRFDAATRTLVAQKTVSFGRLTENARP
jgi:autoinducer 2-degrading protein